MRTEEKYYAPLLIGCEDRVFLATQQQAAIGRDRARPWLTIDYGVQSDLNEQWINARSPLQHSVRRGPTGEAQAKQH